MTQSRHGHRGLSESEAARVRSLFWEWWDAEVAAGRSPTRKEYGRLVGVKGEAVSQFVGKRGQPGSWKNRPARETAQAAARLLKRSRNCWEDDAEEEKPADLDSKRALQVARDIALDEGVLAVLLGAQGVRMKNLSEQKKKAVLGAVHLLGYPLEMAIEAAEQVTEASDDSPVSLFAKIQSRLNMKQPRSGSYPSAKPPSRAAR